jgi:glutaredoxin 3
MPDIIIYSKEVCPYCVRAKALLSRKGVEFTEIKITDDKIREEMIKKQNELNEDKKKFEETHPLVMKERISQKNWDINLDIKKKNLKLKHRILDWFEKRIGRRLFVFKNHKIIKQFTFNS